MNREAILSHNDLVVESVVIPEWDNATVFVRGLTADERDEFEAGLMLEVTKKKRNGKVVKEHTLNRKSIRAKLAVAACCKSEADISPFFLPTDVTALAKKSGAALDRIYDVAARLAGLSERDADELEKKLMDTPHESNG